jgi:excisionase family DNA binding protein
MSKDVMTLAELSQYLDLSPQQIHEKIQQQEIPYALVAQQLRFPKMAIDRWLEAQTIYPGSSGSYSSDLSQALATQSAKKRGPKPKIMVEAASADAPAVKRGPGRPRKTETAPKRSPGRPKKEAGPKRGPGRPRKSEVAPDLTAAASAAPKRRGRPKKEVVAAAIEAPKAKRGRPKKEVVATAVETPKAKRGRPKKSESGVKKAGRPKKSENGTQRKPGRPAKVVAEGVKRSPGRPRKQVETTSIPEEILTPAVTEVVTQPEVLPAVEAPPAEITSPAAEAPAPEVAAAPKTSGPKPKPKRKSKAKSKGKKPALKASATESAEA